ncbi:MAG: hypothetical protein RIQ79_440 [Verrucomicrobiota bacterium]|jgi:hypothetical protein
MNFFSKTARSLIRQAGYAIVRCQKANGYPIDFTPGEIALIESVKDYTKTTPERLHSLIQSVRYLVKNKIPGDLVECGVWRGGSMFAAAKTLIELGDTQRGLYLYDTFTGMVAPTEFDVSSKGIKAADKFEKRKLDDDSSDWCLASHEEVSSIMGRSGYPAAGLHLVKGKVEDTLPAQAPQQIAFLRLDTDWYESTLHELQTLYPRLAPGGVLIIDDYGDWTGARKATDEYFATLATPVFLHRIDDSARLVIKPA